jgi:hypothetical protein
MNDFNPKNKEQRPVITPRGIGKYWGNDDPSGEPTSFAVQLKGSGTFFFRADELQEFEIEREAGQPTQPIETASADMPAADQMTLF